MPNLQVAVVGARGRMGREVSRVVHEADDADLMALVVEPGDPDVGGDPQIEGAPPYSDDLNGAIEGADVLIDFSLPEAFGNVVAAAIHHRMPLVSGTTGLSASDLSALDNLAELVPCFYCPNMSVGIQVMLELLHHAVAGLGPDYDVSVMEAHHRHKRDAPSGTAKRILSGLTEAMRRRGEPTDIPALSIRGGDVVGDHSVYFMGPGDRLEITHRATSRQTFAMGAMRAARWIVKQPPGRYTMSDLLAH